MKRIATILLLAALSLTACGREQPAPEASATGATGATAADTAAREQATAAAGSPTDAAAETAGTATAADSGQTAQNRQIDLTPLSQYPELPTGCEVTSLTMALNYAGVNCDKCEIADNYLAKGDVGTVDFNLAFEGDPRDESSYGCYSGVIVDTAEKVIAAKGASLTVSNLSGTPLRSLFAYIDRGVPVIVWGTQDCQEGHFSQTWVVDGQELTWFTPEHCMVLVGYDDASVRVADPIYGDIRSYDIGIFDSCYQSLFQQAVVIE